MKNTRYTKTKPHKYSKSPGHSLDLVALDYRHTRLFVFSSLALVPLFSAGEGQSRLARRQARLEERVDLLERPALEFRHVEVAEGSRKETDRR